jgi:hypothetical protein
MGEKKTHVGQAGGKKRGGAAVSVKNPQRRDVGGKISTLVRIKRASVTWLRNAVKQNMGKFDFAGYYGFAVVRHPAGLPLEFIRAD